MPKLPQIESDRTPTMGQPLPMKGQITVQANDDTGIRMASHAIYNAQEGLASTFRALEHANDRFTQFNQKIEEAEQQTIFTNEEIRFKENLDELHDQYSQRQDWADMPNAFKKDAQEIVKGYGQGLKGKYALKFNQHIATEVGSVYSKVRSLSRKGKIDEFKASLSASEEFMSRKVANSGVNSAEGNAARAEYMMQINGALSLGVVSDSQAQHMIQKFDEKVEYVSAKQLVSSDPLKGYAILRDSNMFPQLDPLKRIGLQEEAISHARQQDMQRERDERRSERLQEKMEKQRGAELIAKTVDGTTTLPVLKQALKDGKISVTDFNHGLSLLKQSMDGDGVTNQDKYMRMYEGIRSGTVNKDSIIESTQISAKDKVKLLDTFHKAESAEEKLERPIHKNDRDIMRAILKPGGVMNIHTAQQDQAYAYAVENYDKLIKQGMDNVEARERVLKTWTPQAKSFSDLLPPPTVGTPDMDEKTFLKEMDKQFDSGKLTKEQYLEQSKRWKALQIPTDKGGKK